MWTVSRNWRDSQKIKTELKDVTALPSQESDQESVSPQSGECWSDSEGSQETRSFVVVELCGRVFAVLIDNVWVVGRVG